MKGEAPRAASSEGSLAAGCRPHLGAPCSALPGAETKNYSQMKYDHSLESFLVRGKILCAGIWSCVELGVAGSEGCAELVANWELYKVLIPAWSCLLALAESSSLC